VAPRLKVFVSSDGLTDYVVATSSRAKALEAWGVRQDLFKEGRAQETDEAEVRDAALAQPGEVLRRPSGGRAALAKMKPVAKAKPKGPSKAALAKVAALEAELADAQEKAVAAASEAQDLRKRLEAAQGAADAAAQDAEKVEARLAKAREALET
jgi:molecular chaperone GrpE (heat shock protein)